MAEKKRSKKKSAKQKSTPKKQVAIKRKPRQGPLPGMEDMGIKELEKLAEYYADVRDQRMELTRQESQMSTDLLAMMKKHKKTEYHHGEVHIWVKVTEEKIKVKLGEIQVKATDFTPEDEAVQAGESEDELEPA